VFEDFLSDCCIKEENSQEHFVILYKAFQEYCEDNLLEVKLSKTQFSQKFARISGIQRKKFRIHGGKPLYGVIGIRLKKNRRIYYARFRMIF
ncbi:MAG: hypothetical protein IKJ01_09430, partial [Lachnospiraceae bacterium]|nr:hypothetical protein [Lachnospiraceae bacterium]